ncbi:MAG: hypothetical protein QM503_07950 [Bacteroidota bacterium]
MKKGTSNFIVLIITLFVCSGLHATSKDFSVPQKADDSIHNESRKEQREQEKYNLKHSHKRTFIKAGFVYAKLRTTASFAFPDNILSATLSLEDNLGLPDNGFFFTGSFMYRFTPRSGLYVEYYGLNRSVSHTTTKELIFMKDTIPAGTAGNAFFNTHVLSVGYLLSVLKEPDAFLGVYFNLYGMMIETGFSSDNTDLNPNFKFIAPLPSFGIVALFKLNKWLQIHGDVGFFNLQLSTFGGSMYSFDLALDFKPARWIGITVSYQEFDVNIFVQDEHINTTTDYNFRGPALGLSFIF